MGYYQGQGIITSRTSACSSAGSFTTHLGEVVPLARRTTTTVTRYPGVQYPSTPPNAEYGMRAHVFPDSRWSSGSGVEWDTPHVINDYSGSKTDYSFVQIGDSNLYDKTVTQETVEAWRNQNFDVGW